MIRVARANEPPRFDNDVRQKGRRWLTKHPTAKRDFPSYWTAALDDLMSAYREVCAYSCFRIHAVTGSRSADHFAPKSRARSKIYEWDNYRLCCALMNSRKRDFSDVVDPFLVEPDWFRLELVGYQVIPGRPRGATRSLVESTIERLSLNQETFRMRREADAEDYLGGQITFQVLERESPFVAQELRRQGRLIHS